MDLLIHKLSLLSNQYLRKNAHGKNDSHVDQQQNRKQCAFGDIL